LLICDIAMRLGRSQRHLEMQVREKMGANPQVIYRRMRLALARSLAVDTQLSVAEIAVRCGYQNASAMTRAFRAEFCTTPQALRRRLG
jgi:transcriptional regulator GlxA family with amidase domain